ncbi:MAG: hypothetical protein U1E28_13305 [Beijerinckiaceae bacterium]
MGEFGGNLFASMGQFDHRGVRAMLSCVIQRMLDECAPSLFQALAKRT